MADQTDRSGGCPIRQQWCRASFGSKPPARHKAARPQRRSNGGDRVRVSHRSPHP
jgi:hypothetical protein